MSMMMTMMMTTMMMMALVMKTNGNDLDEDDKGSSGLNRGNVCIVQNLKYCLSQVFGSSILIFETWPSLLSPLTSA